MTYHNNVTMPLLGHLKSGEAVYDRPNSHLHKGVRALLPELLRGFDPRGQRFVVHEHDFGRVVGKTACVPTSGRDAVVYAFRPKRQGMTRFVKNRQLEPCSSAVFILKRDDYESYYVLITAFIGHESGPEPWDVRATDANREFWRTHALVWGSEEVIPGTETCVCPW